MKLHLGVINIAYDDASTTESVATELEERYGIMQHFYSENAQKIANYLENDLNDILDSFLNGQPQVNFEESMGKIKKDFTRALEDQFLDGKVKGVATKRAKSGYRSRFKDKKKDKSPRASFIDTGNYLASFKAWIE